MPFTAAHTYIAAHIWQYQYPPPPGHCNEKTSQNYQMFLDYYCENLGTGQCTK